METRLVDQMTQVKIESRWIECSYKV